MKGNDMKNIIISTVIAFILTGSSYLISYYFNWINSINWVEFVSVFTSFQCTYLCVYQSRNNYPIGAISVVALGVLFYQQQLYASMALQIWLFPALLYGWFRWGPDTDTRPVTFVNYKKHGLIYLAVTGFVYVICLNINDYFGGTMAGLDSAILVFSILAQFLLDNKKLENWIVWLAVDVISVYEYADQGLYVLAIQMALFGVNAIWGFYEWNETRKVHDAMANLTEYLTSYRKG
jgi:nicotinamide mononucleotide transporter